MRIRIKERAEVGRGKVIGDDLMLESSKLRQSSRLFALTYLQMLRLPFVVLQKLLLKHPFEAKKVRPV